MCLASQAIRLQASHASHAIRLQASHAIRLQANFISCCAISFYVYTLWDPANPAHAFVQVEQPGKGDALRSLRVLENGTSGNSLWWRAHGRNQRCITANLHTQEGRDIVKQLSSHVSKCVGQPQMRCIHASVLEGLCVWFAFTTNSDMQCVYTSC